ncbi:hypothetical protein ANN_08271 [Periplaneta americana]|uniref:Uncharacterized protein n=1 Tax=Periplaneta americana TaxID=6978 RepID=A0ABQ8T2B2_PERAM|nr:hypothetical protein ANN_08271 [Periplaneta americana]
MVPGAEVMFHFFGGKRDGSKVREALNNLMKRGRLGNLTLVPTHLAFKQEPTLLLQSVKVNQDRIVREGDEFILSCIAQGSSYMTFRWYKDGAFVNKNKTMRSRLRRPSEAPDALGRPPCIFQIMVVGDSATEPTRFPTAGVAYTSDRWRDGRWNMWTKLLPMDSEDRYTALLGIERASHLDEGVYTCQVVDWDMQQCKSIRLEINLRPEVEVIPKSITIERGESVSIKCMSSNDQRHEKFGYNWTKNKVLLRMAPGVEVWEDLHPAGSILKIYNAQKSAVYTCTVHGSVANEAKSVYVEIVNRSVVPLCPEEQVFGVLWPETAPDLYAIQECPVRYLGEAKRRCTLRNTYTTKWELPDFSACIPEAIENIYKNCEIMKLTCTNPYSQFHSLTLGYLNTSGNATLKACHNYLTQRSSLYPGEGEAILEMLEEVLSYMNFTGENEEILASAHSFYEIINILLERNFSVINAEKVVQLQELVKVEALMWGSLLTPSVSTAHLNLSSLALHIALLENNVYKLHLNTSSWLSSKLNVHIESPTSDGFGNGTFSLAVIVYRNLTEFLPMRYVAKLRDGNELEFEINSKVVTVEMGRDGRRLIPSQGVFHVDLEFEHIIKDYNTDGWNVSCGVTYVAAIEHSWDLTACITQTIGTNMTRCSCNRPGTYAALLTKRPTHLPLSVSEHYHTVVLVGCVCCLVQTMFTLFLLLPYWWHHRTCLIFLKLQCCTATSGAMGVFIYAVRDSVPKTSFPYVTTSLEAFLLIGMSSHLSKLMIVYTEVVQIPKVRHMKQTVVSIITGVPVLAVLCNHLAHHSTGWQLKSWWLLCGTMLFNIFIASAVVMLVLFVFLYFTVMRRLKLLSSKNSIGNKAIGRRVGLLRRAGIIFFVMVVMEASSIFYINVPDSTCHYVFSLTSALLGFIIFLCYILKSETPLHIQVLRKLKLENTPEDEYSSESVNSPLRFFTKQEGDAESEGPPPRPGSSLNMHSGAAGEDDDDGDPTEGLLMVETTNRSYQRTPPSEGAPSTIETFVHSVEGSVEDCGVSGSGTRVMFRGSDSRVLLKGDSSDVDLESYHNSPRKYKQQLRSCKDTTDMFSEYVEQDVGLPGVDEQILSGSGDQWRFVRGFYHNGATPGLGAMAVPRPEPAQCYIREQTPPPPTATTTQQEILTTRVCVELGVITAPRQHLDRQGGEDTGAALETPAIVLCSVDVEPCHRGVLELAEVTAAIEANACCTNGGTLLATQEEQEVVTEELVSNDDSKPDGQELPLQRIEAEEEAEKPCNTVERKQPEGREKPQPVVSITPATEAEEDMLDRISHDLDYLLNRKPPQNNGSVLGAPAFSRKTSKPPATSVRSQIEEEDEEDVAVPGETVTNVNGTGKS